MGAGLRLKLVSFVLVAGSATGCVQDYGPFGFRDMGILAVLRPGSGYEFSTLPSRLSIPLPRTLSAQSISTTTGLSTFSQATACSADSFGYEELLDLVSTFREIIKGAYQELMILDGLIPKVRTQFPASTCVAGGTFTVEWTAGMRETIFQSVTDAGLTSAEAEAIVLELETEGYLPRVGSLLPSPVMQYRPNRYGYDHEMKYAFSPEGLTVPYSCDDVAGDFDSVIRWNEDRQRYQLGYKESYDGEAYSGILTLDLAKELMYFRSTYDDGTDSYSSTAGMSVCPGERCVRINYSDYYDPASGEWEYYELDGKADDNGGYARTYYTYDDGGGGAVEEYYKEYFTSGGHVAGMLESADGVTYDIVTGCEDFDYDASVYDDEGIIDVGINVSVGATGCGGDCFFVVIADSEDPNVDPDAIIGAGGEFAGTIDVEYWGDPGSTLTTADIWEITTYDAEGYPVFTQRETTNGNLTQI